ncbi:hypothetical protein ACJ73_06300 [Blastomyces percursus]|uniref:Uncharacterized protein n=1 Tax=Blastomyces percursus TaxID=1658174 RepID=A0A1J9R411_9EURO|nr:hypothetical protein ACJ73_06300 [Blastomyces percursus]
MAANRPTFRELEESAQAAINCLQLFPEFGSARIAIIGGTALWKHIPDGRTTMDVDFIITLAGAPQVVKTKLLQMPNSSFAEFSQFFVYKHPSGKNIQIDFTPEWQSAYVPAAATMIGSINSTNLPYITPLDLLALKINTCGMRLTAAKKSRDAQDALTVAEMLLKHGPIVLTHDQKEAVRVGIEDVGALSGRHSSWWTSALQL